MQTAGGCTGFSFDVSKELKLLGGTSGAALAALNTATATLIDLNQAYAVTLSNQREVTFARKPAKATVADGSYAGLLRIVAPRSKTIRVAATEAAWLDVIADGKLIESTRHAGSPNCKALRKVVEFSVAPNRPVVIQVSGSTEAQIKLAVTTP
jgi:hypothetical protein